MPESAEKIVMEHSREGCELRELFFSRNLEAVVEAGRLMAVCLARGGKIMFCGNGGSAADAQHWAAELVNRFMLERPPLPAIALTTDTSAITAIGNDYGFDQVFLKQVQALGRKGDILAAVSTSGESPNVLLAVKEARDRGIMVIGLTGGDGGSLSRDCDLNLHVAHKSTPLVQEVHGAIGHMLCRLVDYFLFEAVVELQPYLEQTGNDFD